VLVLAETKEDLACVCAGVSGRGNVFEANSLVDARRQASTIECDALVVVLSPSEQELDWLAQTRLSLPEVDALVILERLERRLVHRVFELGAHCILKPIDAKLVATFANRLRPVPKIGARLGRSGDSTANDNAELFDDIRGQFGLTEAEARVLVLVTEGCSNRVAARRLFVSVETVRTHMKRILGKLGVSSRTQAAAHLRDWTNGPFLLPSRASERIE
jgi:DNA-binding NarL/FixJ family response regulator